MTSYNPFSSAELVLLDWSGTFSADSEPVYEANQRLLERCIQSSLEKAGIASEQALYIGDTVQDMQAAHEAGVPAIAITHGYHSERILRAQQPAFVVASLGELAVLARES